MRSQLFPQLGLRQHNVGLAMQQGHDFLGRAQRRHQRIDGGGLEPRRPRLRHGGQVRPIAEELTPDSTHSRKGFRHKMDFRYPVRQEAT